MISSDRSSILAAWTDYRFRNHRFSVLANFFMNWASNVAYVLLNTYEHRYTEIFLIFTIFLSMARSRSIYVVSMWSIIHLNFNYDYRLISWIQTHLFFCLFFRMCPIIFGWQRRLRRMWTIFKNNKLASGCC